MLTRSEKPLPKWAIATTLKCPVWQTTAFVNYYLNLGTDHIYLFFDDPNDPAAEIVGENPRVTATRCTPKYFEDNAHGYFGQFDYSYVIYRQSLNATKALEWSREKGISWIAHVDVDELIYIKRNDLKKILQRSPFGILRFTILEAVPEQLEFENFFHEIRIFKAPAAFHKSGLRYPVNSVLLRLAVLLGVRAPFAVNDMYFRGHLKSKCIVRTDLEIINMRIHSPLCAKRRMEKRVRRINLLHFDSCGMELWKSRWEFRLTNRDRPASKKKQHKINLHMMELLSTDASDENFIESYKKLHFIDESDLRILSALGLVKRIQLPKILFSDAVNQPQSATSSSD